MTAEKSFQSVWLIMLVLSLLFLVWTSLVFAGGSAIKSVARISGVLYITTVLAFLVSNLFLKASLVVAGDVSTTMRLVADHALQY